MSMAKTLKRRLVSAIFKKQTLIGTKVKGKKLLQQPVFRMDALRSNHLIKTFSYNMALLDKNNFDLLESNEHLLV